MKKSITVLLALLLTSFTADRFGGENLEKNELGILKVQKNITEFQNLIAQKQLEAENLQQTASLLTESNPMTSSKMLEKAVMLKMNCHKCQAAIACLERHLEEL